MSEGEAPIVIFDGVCGLCNRAVDFILRHDSAEQFLFAPNQSEAAQRLLKKHNLVSHDADTIYFYDDGAIFKRSDAVLRIAAGLPFPYRATTLGRIIPRPFRDAAYRFVAKRRYGWFGKNETCRIPTAQERSRFLD